MKITDLLGGFMMKSNERYLKHRDFQATDLAGSVMMYHLSTMYSGFRKTQWGESTLLHPKQILGFEVMGYTWIYPLAIKRGHAQSHRNGRFSWENPLKLEDCPLPGLIAQG